MHTRPTSRTPHFLHEGVMLLWLLLVELVVNLEVCTNYRGTAEVLQQKYCRSTTPALQSARKYLRSSSETKVQ